MFLLLRRVQMCTCIDVPLLSNSILWAVPANGFTEELNWIVVSHYSFPPCVTVLAEKKNPVS